MNTYQSCTAVRQGVEQVNAMQIRANILSMPNAGLDPPSSKSITRMVFTMPAKHKIRTVGFPDFCGVKAGFP